LDTLEQTSSVQSYTSAFRETPLELPDMSVADRLHRYVAGLTSHIQQQVQVQNPADMDAAILVADRLDAIQYGGAKSISGAAGTSQLRALAPQQPAWRPPCPAQRPVPMELGVAQVQHNGWRQPPPLPGGNTRLSPEERDHLMDNDGYLFSRRLGRTVDQCRQRSISSNFARPSRQQPNGMRQRH
jgi:hypothetical protein